MFKKLVLATGILATALVGIDSVNAKEYTEADFMDLITNSTEITSADTLTVSGSTYIGVDGSFTINDGSVTFSLDTSTGTNRILMTVDGDVVLNENEKFFVKIPDALEATATGANIEGFSLLVNKDSVFDIDGTVIIPNVGNGKFTNNGTVNVNGAVELRSLGNYTSTGTTNVFGKFVAYGIDGTNLDKGVKFTLNNTGAVYSDFEISLDNFVSATDGMKVAEATVKDYDSVTDSVVTASGNNTFKYGYELTKVEDTTPTQPTEDNDKTPVEDEKVENPQTFDGITTAFVVTLLGLSAFAFIISNVRRRTNN